DVRRIHEDLELRLRQRCLGKLSRIQLDGEVALRLALRSLLEIIGAKGGSDGAGECRQYPVFVQASRPADRALYRGHTGLEAVLALLAPYAGPELQLELLHQPLCETRVQHEDIFQVVLAE